MILISKYIIYATAAFLLSIITGLILHKKGHPYPFVLANLHKLLSLAAVVFVVLEMVNLLQDKNLQLTGMALTGFSGLVVLISIISGGLLTGKKEQGSHLRKTHRVSSVVSLVFIVISLIWFNGLN
ncbi:MAG: hypothetical protein ACQES1_07430 [Bacteroidota bacterium]